MAEVLSLPIRVLIEEKAFFLLKQKVNCSVPAGANTKPMLFAGWEGSASRFVGENAGMHIQQLTDELGVSAQRGRAVRKINK